MHININDLNVTELLNLCQQVDKQQVPAPSLVRSMAENHNRPFIAKPDQKGELIKVADMNNYWVERLVRVNHNLNPAWYEWIALSPSTKPDLAKDYLREYAYFESNPLRRVIPPEGKQLIYVNAAGLNWSKPFKHPKPKWGEIQPEILKFQKQKELTIYPTCHTKEGFAYIENLHEGRIAALCDFVDQGSAEYAILKLHVAAAKRFVKKVAGEEIPPNDDFPYSISTEMRPEDKLVRSIGAMFLAKRFRINFANEKILAQINQDRKIPGISKKHELQYIFSAAFYEAKRRVEFLLNPSETLKLKTKPKITPNSFSEIRKTNSASIKF